MKSQYINNSQLAKFVLVLTLLTFSLCLAEQTGNLAVSDSIAIEALLKSHEFYRESFNQIQSSYNIFLFIVCVLVTISVGLLVFFNIKHEKDLDRKFLNSEEKLNKEIKDQIKQQQELFEEKLENQKNEFANLKQEQQDSFNKEFKKIEHTADTLFLHQSGGYYYSAKEYFEKSDFSIHFLHMLLFFKCLKGRITLKARDLNDVLKSLEGYFKFIDEYNAVLKNDNFKKIVYNDNEDKDHWFDVFIKSILEFIRVCEDEKMAQHLYKAKSIYNKLCDMFKFSSDDIKNRIKKYFKISGREDVYGTLEIAEKYRDIKANSP